MHVSTMTGEKGEKTVTETAEELEKKPPFCVQCGVSEYVCGVIKASGAFPSCCPDCTHGKVLVDINASLDAGPFIEYEVLYDMMREYTNSITHEFLETPLDNIVCRIYDYVNDEY